MLLLSEKIMLYPLMFLAIALCFATIYFQNPVNAVLSFIGVFIISAGFLLSVGIEFLAITYLVVYIGAVAVLFLFIVMLLNAYTRYTEPKFSSVILVVSIPAMYSLTNTYQHFRTSAVVNFLDQKSNVTLVDESNAIQSVFEKPTTLKGVIRYFRDSFFIRKSTTNSVNLDENNISIKDIKEKLWPLTNDIHMFGNELYTKYSTLFLITTLILLVALIGVIVLTIHKENPLTHFFKNISLKKEIWLVAVLSSPSMVEHEQYHHQVVEHHDVVTRNDPEIFFIWTLSGMLITAMFFIIIAFYQYYWGVLKGDAGKKLEPQKKTLWAYWKWFFSIHYSFFFVVFLRFYLITTTILVLLTYHFEPRNYWVPCVIYLGYVVLFLFYVYRPRYTIYIITTVSELFLDKFIRHRIWAILIPDQSEKIRWLQNVGIALSILAICICRFRLLDANTWIVLLIYLTAYFSLQSILLYRLFSAYIFDPIAIVLEKNCVNGVELKLFVDNELDLETTKGRVFLATIKQIANNSLTNLWLESYKNKVNKNKRDDIPRSPSAELYSKTPFNVNDIKNNNINAILNNGKRTNFMPSVIVLRRGFHTTAPCCTKSRVGGFLGRIKDTFTGAFKFNTNNSSVEPAVNIPIPVHSNTNNAHLSNSSTSSASSSVTSDVEQIKEVVNSKELPSNDNLESLQNNPHKFVEQSNKPVYSSGGSSIDSTDNKEQQNAVNIPGSAQSASTAGLGDEADSKVGNVTLKEVIFLVGGGLISYVMGEVIDDIRGKEGKKVEFEDKVLDKLDGIKKTMLTKKAMRRRTTKVLMTELIGD